MQIYTNISVVLCFRRQLLLAMLMEGPKKSLTNLHVRVCFENACVAFFIVFTAVVNSTDL